MNKSPRPYNVLMFRLTLLNTQGGTGYKSGIFEGLDHHVTKGPTQTIYGEKDYGRGP